MNAKFGLRLLLAAMLTVTLLSSSARGQPYPITFSLDFQGPTVNGPGPFTGIPSFFPGYPLDEGQILTPGLPGPPGPNTPAPGPLPPPGSMVTPVPGGPGVIPGGLGIVPGAFGAVELDALSYGRDIGNVLYFSVDEWASGDPRFAPPIFPTVFTEGSVGTREASADLFRYLGQMPVGPVFPPPPPPMPGPGNLDFYDGDGLAPGPPGMFGLGLREPNPPAPGPDFGDNLDAVDFLTNFNQVAGRTYFSLDSRFPDPLEMFFPPINSGTAFGNGFSGGQILQSAPGGVPVIFAPAPVLGLDLIGFDTDDLDALALNDVGNVGVFDLGIDTVLFSVRRGSAVIGRPDSAAGIPIEEGDILTVPTAAGMPPAMVLPAEMLGLATWRSNTVVGPGAPFADDLDALDVTLRNNADFDNNSLYNCNDVNQLVAAIVAGGGLGFDLTGDGLVDRTDLAVWLIEAGVNNLGPGRYYLPADATLDGNVDGADFIVWNANKFTATPKFCSGDFNADGLVDGNDFLIWNAFKFRSSDLVASVPEPTAFAWIVLGILAVGMRRRC